MDCGDEVTVKPFHKKGAQRNDNGSKLANADRLVILLDMDSDSYNNINDSDTNEENKTALTPATGVQVNLLHPRCCEMLEAMQNSIHSSDSSNNSHNDICILEVNESHYSIEPKCENKEEKINNLDNSGSSIDAPDFTVVHAPSKVLTLSEQSPLNKQKVPELQEQLPNIPALKPLSNLKDEFPKTLAEMVHAKETMLPLEQLPELDDNSLPTLEPLPLPEDPSEFFHHLQLAQSQDLKPLNRLQQTQSLQKLQHRESISGAFEESTEVLLVHSSEYNGRSMSCGHAFSGTDSDVEVLMSEEVIESDWSAGATATDDLVRTPDEGAEELDMSMTTSQANKNNNISKRKLQLSTLVLKNPQDSTDQEHSVEEFSYGSSSVSTSDQLSRLQLQKVINEQAAHIRQLESKIQRYHRAQQALFGYVEALRLTLEPDD